MSYVPLYLDLLGSALDRGQNTLIKLGNLETKLLTYDIETLKIEKPVFVTGMARAGTTILTEILASHPAVTSHQYRDYPFVHVHYFWQLLRTLIPARAQKVERAHKDGLMINAHSPEALDEILWMSFFEGLHVPNQSAVLKTENESFDRFYKNNILKTLYGRKATRFVSKNNYNITRLKYLRRLFPDARFVIPVRRPTAHIASLLKQNTLFRDAQKEDPRSQRYTRRLGHFEFGLDFRPINPGDPAKIDKIQALWREENFLEAYAHYWTMLHQYLWHILDSEKDIRSAVHLVLYDDFCHDSATQVKALLEFCTLFDVNLAQDWADKIKAPTYYIDSFTDEQKQRIADITADTEKLFWAS